MVVIWKPSCRKCILSAIDVIFFLSLLSKLQRHALSFGISCFCNKSLSYQWVASVLRQFWTIFFLQNAHKTEYMCFNQTGDISTREGSSLKLVDKFTYLGSRVSSTEKDIDTRLTKAWTPIDKLSIMWKSDLTDKIKRSFFQKAVVSILLYGFTPWALIKRLEKNLDGSYTRMLRAILNKSWRQHTTRHQLYGNPASHHENYPI